MPDILAHPAVQAAVIPAIVSAVAAASLYKIRAELAALALLVGFLATSAFITDISLAPLTSTKKIILLTIFSAILGITLQTISIKKRPLLILLAISSLMACSWILWPVLSRKEWLDAVTMAVPLAFYCFIVVAVSTNEKPAAMQSAFDLRIIAIVFAIATSISCVIGASALYGQLSASLAASTAGLLLVASLLDSSIRKKHQSDELFGMILFLPVSLIAIAATVYAKVPWYVLPCLAAIPAVMLIKFSNKHKQWKRLTTRLGLATLPGGLALFLTWDAAGPVPF